jgi:hypothetical protein
MMDSLSTCMVCDIDLNDEELLIQTNDTDNVVVVSDAKCIGYQYSDDVISFEEDDKSPYRAVYCNECWGKLVSYSWKLVEKLRKESEV